MQYLPKKNAFPNHLCFAWPLFRFAFANRLAWLHFLRFCSAAPVHTGPGAVTFDTLPVADLGGITAEKLEQLKGVLAQKKIPIQSTEKIDSKTFTEKLLEFQRSVTWTIPATSFIDEGAQEAALKKKKEEAKKAAEEKKAEEAKKKEEDAKKKDEDEGSKKEDEKKEETGDKKPEESKEEEKKVEEKVEEKKEAQKTSEESSSAAPASASTTKTSSSTSEEKKDEKKDDKVDEEKKTEESEQKDAKKTTEADEEAEKLKKKKEEEDDEPYPEFDDDEKEEEDMKDGKPIDISVNRKSTKFTVSFSSVQIVDMVELDFGLARTWFDGGDALKYKYSVTLEYNTAPGAWTKVWDRLLLDDVFTSSIQGRSKKSRMLQLNVAFRAQKLRLRFHVAKKTAAELEAIKDTASSIVRKFTYAEDFDKNGVFYWIGSSYGKTSYSNPQVSGDVTVTLSHHDSAVKASEFVISHSALKEAVSFGGSAPVWFSVDLGPHLTLSPDYYSLRHGFSYADSIIADWEFQGSNNNETWTTLHAQLEAPFSTGWATKSWPVTSGEQYRYFRIYQKGNYAYGPGQGPNGSPYLYIGGFELYGDLRSSASLSPNIVSSLSFGAASLSPAGIEKNREYVFSHDGDTNGVLYAIGSSDGTEKWSNPARNGKVKTKLSGQSWNDADKWNCIARASDNNTSAYWGGSLPVWFYVDLGTERKICPRHYTLRHGCTYNENFLQNWELQCSNNAEEWTTVHSGTDSPFQYAHQMVSWPVKDCKQFYRYFRVFQKSNSINGPGNESGPYMYISGFEIYGLHQEASAGSGGPSTPQEAQKRRSLANMLLTNEEYHLQLLKTVHADTTAPKLRLQCLEMLDTILSRSVKLPAHILKAIDIKTFLRVLCMEGDKASCAQGGRWLQYLLAMHRSPEEAKVFRRNLLDAILELLPTVVDSLQSAHNLDQISNLFVTAWSADPTLATKKCYELLLDLGRRLQSNMDHHYLLLRNRFSIYDFVLESDSFAEPAVKKKANPQADKKKSGEDYDDGGDDDEDNGKEDFDAYLDTAEQSGGASGNEEGSESIDILESQLVQAILAYERNRSKLRTVLEHVSMSLQPGSSATKPSASSLKEVQTAHKDALTSQHAVHRWRTALQSKVPTHAALKNTQQNIRLDRWNVIAERLLAILSTHQKAEKDAKSSDTSSTSSTSSIFADPNATQEMFTLFCINGSPFMQRTMTSFLRHVSDPKVFAISVLRRLFTDEHFASSELVPYEEVFAVLRELSTVDESTVVGTSRQLFQLLAECTVDSKKMDYQLATWTLRLLGALLKSSLAHPHPYSKCKNCSATPIRGVRYRCLQCVDYDICAKCEATHPHDAMHTFVKIDDVLPLSPSLSDPKLALKAKEPLLSTSLYASCTEPDSEDEPPKWPHVASVSHTVVCDYCGDSITGIRYKCINCNQYNVCTGCEASDNVSHYKHHLFAKVYHPLPLPTATHNDAKTLVNVLLHPGLYPHPAKQDLPTSLSSTDKKKISEAPAAISSPSPVAAPSATPAGETSATSSQRLSAADFGKGSPTPLMRASTGVPMLRKETPSPSLADALNAAEPEFGGSFLATLVNAMSCAMTLPSPSYELLLLASNCMRSLAYQYSPEDTLQFVIKSSPQFFEVIEAASALSFQFRAALTPLVHDLCRASTYVNMLKETAETTLKPLRAAVREKLAKLLADAVNGKSGATASSAAAKSTSAAKSTASATASAESSTAASAAKGASEGTKTSEESKVSIPVSSARVQFLLNLLQGCCDSSDISVEKKAAKVVDWRTASAPLKNFMPSTTTVYPVDTPLLTLIWQLLDTQNLSGASLQRESVQIVSAALSLLLSADLSLVANSASFQRFLRATYLSKTAVHRTYWRQLNTLNEKLILGSSKNSEKAAIATSAINNLFSLLIETMSSPTTARDMMLVSTLVLLKKKKSLLKPAVADLAKLASLCIQNLPTTKTLDTASEDEFHVFEIDALALVSALISADSFTEANKAELLAAEAAGPASASTASVSASSTTSSSVSGSSAAASNDASATSSKTSTSGSATATASASATVAPINASSSSSASIIGPLVDWISACDRWQAQTSTAVGGNSQVLMIRKNLVTFLHLLCEVHPDFAKRSLTALASTFREHKLKSVKLVDLSIELMRTEALARMFIVDLDMGSLLQSELEVAEGSVKRSEVNAPRPSMFESLPTVATPPKSGMTNFSSTVKVLEPADDHSAENTIRYGSPGSTSHQWSYRWPTSSQTYLGSKANSLEHKHALTVLLRLPQPALIREIWFDLVRHYSSTTHVPPCVTFEVGSCKEDLVYVASLDTPSGTIVSENSQTFKTKLEPPQIGQFVRITFERPQASDMLILSALPLLGSYNLLEDADVSKGSASDRKTALYALSLLEHAFHFDSIRTFYGQYEGTTDLALQLLTMSTEETKNQVQTIALHLARHRPGLVSTLFAHFSKMGIPSSSSRFVGRLCAVADDQTSARIQNLSEMVFTELSKADSTSSSSGAISAATSASASEGTSAVSASAASPSADRLIAVMNALSEALFVLLAAHRPIELKLTDAQVLQIANASLKPGSSLALEAYIRLLSCLTQADTSRYALLQNTFGLKEGSNEEPKFDQSAALSMLSILAPLSTDAATALTSSPILKVLASEIVTATAAAAATSDASSGEDASSTAVATTTSSASKEQILLRAANFISSVSHHPRVKEWVTSNVLESFLDILSERKFGATVQFAVQSAVRTACNLSPANQDAVAAYLMKAFKAATSSSSGVAAVSDAMLQLLEDMLNINDKVLLCLHSKNETSEELLLCDTSTSGGGVLMALDPENSHEDMTLDEDTLTISGGNTADYVWKTAIVANAAPSNGPVSWTVTIDRSSGGNMMLGVAVKTHPHSTYVGGADSPSKRGWAYYGCSPGYKYHNASVKEYGRAFNVGDVVGVHMNQAEGTLSFSINGEDLGVAFTDLPNDEALYPAVSICQNSDSVRLSQYSTSAGSSSSAGDIDNKHPLFFQRSNKLSPIALGTPLATIADALIGRRNDRKVVFTRFPKNAADKDSESTKEELNHNTSLHELLDPSSEVLDVTFSLIPIVPESKSEDEKKKDKKKKSSGDDDEDAEEADDSTEDEKKKEEEKAKKEKEKSEVAKRKAELDAKKRAHQTGVMKRFASQKGLEMLLAILSARLSPTKPAASATPASTLTTSKSVSEEKSNSAEKSSTDSTSAEKSTTDAPSSPKTEEKAVDSASTSATATPAETPSTPAESTPEDSTKVEDEGEKQLTDEELAKKLMEEEMAALDGADQAALASVSDEDGDLGFDLFDNPDADTLLDAPAPTSKSNTANSKKKKKDEKKKGFVSKETWAKWVKLLSDCLVLDGVVDAFVQDEDCRAMLFCAIEAAKNASSALALATESSGSASTLEPLPQPSKQALEAPLIPLYQMLLTTLASASNDAAKAATYREQLHSRGLLKSCLVDMMELCDVLPVNAESANFKTEADAIKTEREEKAAEKKKANSGSTQYWAKGTGYGTNSDEKTDFNLTAYVRETVLTGKKVTQLLEVAAFMLSFEAPAENASLPEYQTSINQMILDSPIRPVMEQYLRNDSLLEMARCLDLYKALFKITQLMSAHEFFLPILCPDDSSSNVYTLMEHLQRVAALVQKLPAAGADTKKGKKKGGKDADASTSTKSKPVADDGSESSDSDTESAAASKKKAKDEADDNAEALAAGEAGADEPNEESEKLLADEIQKTFEKLKSKMQARREVAKSKQREATEKDGSMTKTDKLIELYCTTLRDLQFGDTDMLEKGKDDEFVHHYKGKIKSDTAPGQKKMKRLVQELSVLSTSLPLHPDSSVFLRVDEQRIDVCKVLITGPDQTPYESGCFQFDMYLESDYPKVSPKINLMTTGHGSVRFNPNLYNCGKVCLSLLGTWPGGANEEWNEETSTILQLMISIQSLIFVPEPYFNEPGYESSMNSETGRTQSRQYNENIRIQTLRWAMIDQLKNPSPGFEEVIKTHFKLKKELILEQLDAWTAEFVAHADDGPTKEFEKLVAEFQKLLNTL